MDIGSIILFAGVLIFAAHLFEWLFSFTKIPDVLLLIVVGLLLGPLFGVLTPDFFGESGALFSVVVLAIMLFEGGTELRLDVLRNAWGGASKLVMLNFFATFAIVGLLVWWLTDLHPLLAFMLGSILGGTTSSVVIPLLDQLGVGKESSTMLFLESAFSDVLSIVITIALLTAYELGQFDVSGVALDVIVAFLGAGIIGAIGGFFWSVLLNKVRNLQNSLFTTPAFMFVLFGIAERFGFSGPIAALAFGVTLGNVVFFKLYLEKYHLVLRALLHPVTLSDQERSFFSEVVFLLQTLFFVYVGMSITFSNTAALLVGFGLVAMMFIIRIPAVRLAAPKEATSFDRSIMAVMVPKGLAAAVLAALVVQRGIEGGAMIREVTFSAILISVVLTSLLIFLVYKTGVRGLYQKIMGGVPGVPAEEEEAANPTPAEGGIGEV